MLPIRKLLSVMTAMVFAFPNAESGAKKPDSQKGGDKINVGGDRPFDAVSIFGDLGDPIELLGTRENKTWWERLIRGDVGKDRFLILCALKDGNWKILGDIRDYVEFQTRKTYPAIRMQGMLIQMSGPPILGRPGRHSKNMNTGEGWVERNSDVVSSGIESEWRIAPNVYPLLYFLLMNCPEDDRCR